MKDLLKLIAVIFVLVIIFKSCFGSSDDDSEDIDANSVYTITLAIDYKETSFSYNDTASIYVDDTKIGSIAAGKNKKYEATVNGGKHEIWVKGGTSIRTNESSKVKIKVDEKNTEFFFNLKDDSFVGLLLSERAG